jgi:hypothetical protein
MVDRKLFHIPCAVLIWLAAVSSNEMHAQIPTTWWPDPTTGLMWTGRASGPGGHLPGISVNFQEAIHYCSVLKLGGYTDWRLPTLDEVIGISYVTHFILVSGISFDGVEFKAYLSGPYLNATVWTSSLLPNQEVWAVIHGNQPGMEKWAVLQTEKLGALCVRPMEANVLEIAKDAQVTAPVTDVQMLTANVPLTKARLAYVAGNYQESLLQSENALKIDPNYEDAYWAIGISYGRLGQWDSAISNLKIALKIDKRNGDAKYGLKWAQDAQKAAGRGRQPKEAVPAWNSSLEPKLCYEDPPGGHPNSTYHC